MKHRRLWGSLWVVAVGVGIVVAQEQTPGSKGAAAAGSAEDAVRAVSAAFVKAYNARDAEALGRLFTEGAEIEDDDGTITRGHDAIVARFTERLSDAAPRTLAVAVESIHFLSPTLAVETGVATVSAGAGSPEKNHYSVLYVKQDDRWLQARIRDEDDDSEPGAAHEHLAELEWMRGEWVNESDDALVSTTCDWADNGAFLVRKFDVKVEGSIALQGTQRIGWDPVLKQFRTWVFDTEGGFAEGLMAHDGDRWLVKVSGVRADGRSASATNIITRLGPDRIGWESAERTLGGEAVPGIDRFIVVRKPPEPGR
jgi:uncharacterized protein (TIGR02246 family)